MSGETRASVSSWTIDSLKEHFEQRLLDQEKAIQKEEDNAEKWRQSANEWRQSMLDREVKFAQRAEVETELKAIRAEIHALRETQALTAGDKTGRMSQQQMFMVIIPAFIGSLILIGGVVVGIAYSIRN
jgi:hypothetical protein